MSLFVERKISGNPDCVSSNRQDVLNKRPVDGRADSVELPKVWPDSEDQETRELAIIIRVCQGGKPQVASAIQQVQDPRPETRNSTALNQQVDQGFRSLLTDRAVPAILLRVYFVQCHACEDQSVSNFEVSVTQCGCCVAIKCAGPDGCNVQCRVCLCPLMFGAGPLCDAL